MKAMEDDHAETEIDSPLKYCRVFIHVIADGLRMKAFVDTGADKNIISSEVYQKFLAHWPLGKSKITLKGVTGTPADCLGIVRLPVDIGNNVVKFQTFYVMKNLQYPMILGHPTLNDGAVGIEYPGPKVRVQGKPVQTFTWDRKDQKFVETERNTAITVKNTILKPRTTDWIEVAADERVFR